MTPSLQHLREIVDGRLCHRCGSCAGICPASVIEPDDDHYPSWDRRAADCTDCGLCVKVCPGRSFSFPDHARRIFGAATDFAADHGHWRKVFLGYATDERFRREGTSGGIATALPAHLLARGAITGALAVRSDPAHPWRPQAFLARTEDDLRSAANSKYPACSTNHLLRDAGGKDERLLFTGLPCQVHGLRRMAALRPRIESQTALVVGLLCHSCLDHGALRDMFACYGVDERDFDRVVYRFGKLPGFVRARRRDGTWIGLPYPRVPLDGYRPNAKECLTFLFKFYSPLRCRMCIDATADFADISIGDPWIRGWEGVARLRQGYNLVIARTGRGLEALESARAEGAIVLEPFPERAVRESQAPMVRGKRRRAAAFIARRARRGLPVPDYGMEIALTLGQRLRAVLHASSYFAADRPRLRRAVFAFLLSRAGRLVVGALFFRRRVLQALWERWKTRLTGRDVVARGQSDGPTSGLA